MTSTHLSARAKLAPATSQEARFLLVALCFIAAAFFLPAFAQPQDYHRFVDERLFASIPRAFDVLSNLSFFFAGIWGLRALSAAKQGLSPALLWSLEIFFWGVMATAAGSAFYHWAPDDSRLLWDRLPMTFAFAGACGAMASIRVGERAGRLALIACLAYGAISLAVWRSTGNLTPYAIMQFGGLAWIGAAWIFGSKKSFDLPWGGLLGFYVAAKALEHFDAQFFALAHHAISGHTAKHLLAAAGAATFAWALAKRARRVSRGEHA